MIILGVDPGLASLGYALIKGEGDRAEYQTCGVIRTKSQEKKPTRLAHLYDFLWEMAQEYNPDILSVEKVFLSGNAKSAMDVGEARGVILLLAEKMGLTVYEYTPLEVKQTVTGYGKADKGQVKKMVQLLLNIQEIPSPADATDALALAICCLHRERFYLKVQHGGKRV